MLASLPLAAVAAHGPHLGGGFPFFALLIPLFWIAVIVVLAVVFSRRRRWALRNGLTPWGGPWAGHPAMGGWGGASGAARAAEATLAERFARGDIEEVEYRARLEVLRANAAPSPQG